MSIFKNILSKIFPSAHAANKNPPQGGVQPTPTAAQGSVQPTPAASSQPAPSVAQTPGGGAAQPAPATANAGSQQNVDVEAVLNEMQSKNSEKLNWKTSIVDLLKLLGLDSSLSARKQLATELHYSGNMDDSAAMNIWLHKEVMRKLAENGGKVPEDLKH